MVALEVHLIFRRKYIVVLCPSPRHRRWRYGHNIRTRVEIDRSTRGVDADQLGLGHTKVRILHKRSVNFIVDVESASTVFIFGVPLHLDVVRTAIAHREVLAHF